MSNCVSLARGTLASVWMVRSGSGAALPSALQAEDVGWMDCVDLELLGLSLEERVVGDGHAGLEKCLRV
jgi:hypothetical protein